MQSYNKKFEGREWDVLTSINEKFEGRPYSYAAMEHFGAKDDIAWRKWVDRWTEKLGFKFLELRCGSIAETLKPPEVRRRQKDDRRISVLKLIARLQAEKERLDKECDELDRLILLGELAWNVEGDYNPPELKL